MNSQEQTRRRLLALGGMTLWTLSGLGGCGGGGDAPPSAPPTGGGPGPGAPGGGSPGTPVGPSQRLDTLDAVTREVMALAAGGLRFDPDELVRRLQALPTLQSVGVSTRMQNVWARFTDGRALVVPNNLRPAPASASALNAPSRRRRALADAGDDFPLMLTAPQYRQLDMFGQPPADSSVDAVHFSLPFIETDTLPKLRRIAMGRGFSLPEQQTIEPPDVGHDNGIEGLKGIGGDGVFFINGCAAEFVGDSGSVSTICTATPANALTEERYATLLERNVLTYAVCWRGVDGAWVPLPCLAITPAFAEAFRWAFPPASVGIFNLTGGPMLSDWVDVLRSAGLRHMMGWQEPVPWQRAIAFGDDLMRLLLAVGHFEGDPARYGVTTPPPLRAYGVGETLGFLANAGLAGPRGMSGMIYLQETNARTYVNTLLPTIDYIAFHEGEDHFELHGQFGAQQPEGEVRFGGSLGRFDEPMLASADPPLLGQPPSRSPEWAGDLIKGPLDDALARGGYVQVFNGGRHSNLVPVTFWELPVEVVTTISGGLRVVVTVTLHLRADMRGYRLLPTDRPGDQSPFMPWASMLGSRAEHVASGSISASEAGTTTTISWSGSGSVGNAPGLRLVIGDGVFDRARRSFQVFVNAAGGRYDERTLVQRLNTETRQLETVRDTTESKPVGVGAPTDPSRPLEFFFDERWRVMAGSYEGSEEEISLLGTRTRRTSLSWQAAEPRFAPEDGVGGV